MIEVFCTISNKSEIKIIRKDSNAQLILSNFVVVNMLICIFVNKINLLQIICNFVSFCRKGEM